MDLYQHQYYHIYNRTINNELLFRENENYLYFLNNYRRFLSDFIDTICYCLMPTHFHMLIQVTSEDIRNIQKSIGIWLSSYTKAINKRFDRKGSLFQQHTKARLIKDDRDIITVLTYIHQNPVRAGLVQRIEDWTYSSYRDYLGLRNGTLPKKDLVFAYYSSISEFRRFSEQMIKNINCKFWI